MCQGAAREGGVKMKSFDAWECRVPLSSTK